MTIEKTIGEWMFLPTVGSVLLALGSAWGATIRGDYVSKLEVILSFSWIMLESVAVICFFFGDILYILFGVILFIISLVFLTFFIREMQEEARSERNRV